MRGIKMCCLHTDRNQISLSCDETHAGVHAPSLYVDSKHRAACGPSVQIQKIHPDRHATI